MKFTNIATSIVTASFMIATTTQGSINVVKEHDMIFYRKLVSSNSEAEKSSCGSEMTIRVSNQYKPFEVLVNGEIVGERNGGRGAVFTHSILDDEDIVIGISSRYDDNFLPNEGIEVEVELCGNKMTTNYEWLCSDIKPSGNSWSTKLFDSDDWRQARILSTNENNEHLNAIWSKGCGADETTESHCRMIIPNTCSNPCIRAESLEEVATRPDLTCLEVCNEEMTEIKDYCDRYNHIFTSNCHTCSEETTTWVKNDCRSNGCDYEDCLLEKPQGMFDMSCFDDCVEEMNDIEDTCKAQFYMLTSETCGQKCSEQIRQYARNNCQRKGCGRVDCDLPTFAPTSAPTPAPTPVQVPDEIIEVSTPAPTPDTSCFAGCLFGANRIEDECEKVDFTLNSGCARCPPETMEWGRSNCPSLGCTPAQCNGP